MINSLPIIVLIGSTGMVGKLILEDIANKQAVIRVVTRRDLEGWDEMPKNFEIMKVDFDNLTSDNYDMIFKDASVLISALGTTMAKAKTAENFRKVDYDHNLSFATAAYERGVRKYILVSAAGADSKSWFNYPKVKGELEEAVKLIAWKSISIFRPGVLMGVREDSRCMESFLRGTLKLMGTPKSAATNANELSAVINKIALDESLTGLKEYSSKDVNHVYRHEIKNRSPSNSCASPHQPNTEIKNDVTSSTSLKNQSTTQLQSEAKSEQGVTLEREQD